MKLLEPASPELLRKIEGRLSTGEEELVRVASDLLPDGSFGSRWLVVTGARVLVIPVDSADGVTDLSIGDISSAQTEAVIGGGRLNLERKAGPTVSLAYSSSLSTKFSEVARGIEQLRKEEPFLINTRLERTRCEKCGLLLPEKDGICPACIHRLATLKRIAGYMLPYKGRAVLLALASIVTTFGELIPPLVTRRIVDDVLVVRGAVTRTPSQRATLLLLLVLALFGVRVLNWAAEWLHGWTVTYLGARVTAGIRSQLYRKLELLSLQFYDKRQIGSIMSRVTNDAGMLQDFLIDGLPYLIINSLMVVGILGFLFSMSWRLTLYTFVPVPILLLWGIYFWKRMRRYFHRWWQAWAKFSARVNESLSGIRVVKAFAQEEREIAEFGRRNRDVQEIGIKTDRYWSIFFATMGMVTGLGVMIVYLFGGNLVIEGEMTVGTLLAFYAYMWLFYGPLQWFGRVNSWMTRAFTGAERIFEIIDSPHEAYEDPDARPMPSMQGRVTFRKTTFGYDKSKPVLHDIDLDVEPGEMIGLVGKSGVGKTTTVNLICRFYDTDHGVLEIDGVDIRKIRLEDLRRQIGIVPQEPFLFNGSIAENIGYGRPDASFEEIVAAARAANAHGFVLTKPDGYDTRVGERGSRLSGGERQRVAIARAILHDPKILILDEATSSVDTQTEKQIQEAIGRLVRNRTTFAIAHRLSTLRDAHRLVVLESGRIVEMGTHQELLEKQGVFYNLVELQHQVAEIIAVKE